MQLEHSEADEVHIYLNPKNRQPLFSLSNLEISSIVCQCFKILNIKHAIDIFYFNAFFIT